MENSDFYYYPLKEVVNFYSGGTPSKDVSLHDKYWNGNIPWISAKNMTDYKVWDSTLNISQEGLENGSRSTEVGDILLLVRGSGLFNNIPINLVSKVVAFNQDIKCLRAKNPDYQEYIYYWLYAHKKNLSDILEETGIGAGKLDSVLLNKIEINIPKDKLVREKLVEISKSLFDKIDLLHQQNQTLEALAETLFRQWFIEDAKEDWENCTINDLAIHSKISIHPNKNSDTLYHHYSIPSFDANKKAVVELGKEIQSNKYAVEANSILFSKLNPHKDKRVWLILDNVEDNAVCSTELQVVKPKDAKYLYFLYGWLTHPMYYNEIASGVGGTSGSHQRIDPTAIFSAPCVYINESLIVEYNIHAEPLFKKQFENQQQIQTLTKLRDTLLPKLMNGEVGVEI